MNRKSVVSLAELPSTHLAVACRRCDRRGNLRVTKLIAEHGDIGLPHLAAILPGECPKRAALPEHARCSVYFPQLGPGNE
jgi:hypothetical protein